MCTMLDLDISVIIIFALVGILLVVLNRLYYKPIGQVIEERDSKISNESNRIKANISDINDKTAHIEGVLKETQKESRKIKEDLIKTGEEVREQTLKDAREKARHIFDSKMAQLDEQILSAEKKLEQEIGVFSNKIKEIFIS